MDEVDVEELLMDEVLAGHAPKAVNDVVVAVVLLDDVLLGVLELLVDEVLLEDVSCNLCYLCSWWFRSCCLMMCLWTMCFWSWLMYSSCL